MLVESQSRVWRSVRCECESEKATRTQKRVAGTKKAALFDIVKCDYASGLSTSDRSTSRESESARAVAVIAPSPLRNSGKPEFRHFLEVAEVG